ncbi:hypothetical protein HYS03_01675 [Candidatus Woesebacteria bacterium]|nr:hypothetical protein [Candidatus Woesebacteria bacterium]QQG47028.1 MAG: hypothetical protein HY044_02715 [Candidatus Woesebacteria bacterium]
MPAVGVRSIDGKGVVIIHPYYLEVFLPDDNLEGVSNQFIIDIDPNQVCELEIGEDIILKDPVYIIKRPTIDELRLRVLNKGSLTVTFSKFKYAVAKSK